MFWANLSLYWDSDGVPLGHRLLRLPPLDPAEIGQDQSRVVGRDTRPSTPHKIRQSQRNSVVLGISVVVSGLSWGPLGL